jgi:hypothetical protein
MVCVDKQNEKNTSGFKKDPLRILFVEFKSLLEVSEKGWLSSCGCCGE